MGQVGGEEFPPLQPRDPQLTSVRIGDLPDRTGTRARSKARSSRIAKRVAAIAAIVGVLVAGLIVLYFSPIFTIENVEVKGSDHLTSAEVDALMDLPQGTTLLNVDIESLKASLTRDTWIDDVTINRIFPSTLEVVVTERAIAAVVDVPNETETKTQSWAIASDGMWLMPIPDRESDMGKSLSQQIYDDVDHAIKIDGLTHGAAPVIGTLCTDENIKNALEIINGFSPSLADQIRSISAPDVNSTVITLDNGVEIAFGSADDVRDKERICLEVMEQNPGKVAYINVRTVERPTWRAI